MCSRTYFITVPWNSQAIGLPQKRANKVFPKIDDISKDFVCKRIEATIENEEGEFYGSVSKMIGQPSGYGVFVTKEWIHCGEVLSGAFFGPNKVSMNKSSNKFSIVTSHKKYLPTGVQFDLCQKTTANSFVSGFFVDGVYQAQIVERFNFFQKDESWLALSPNSKYIERIYKEPAYFGEVNSGNEADGRGIFFDPNDPFSIIRIGHWKNGERAAGSFITIRNTGEFAVGERFMRDG